MKIKCFDYSDLPVKYLPNEQGEIRDIVYWPVSSDFSWCASFFAVQATTRLDSIANIDRYILMLEGEQLALLCDDGIEYKTRKQALPLSCRGEDAVSIIVDGITPILSLNLMVRHHCWTPKFSIISSAQRLPQSAAGILFSLEGEWHVQGANCNSLKKYQGGWWLPDIREGVVTPVSPQTDNKMLWIDLVPD